MTLREIYRAGITFWFGNHYKLDAYVLRDGKKHPFALICPGGAYMLVSEENEGHTFAAELNRRGISAFVLHYRCRRKGRYPAPQQDVARALHEILAQADALHLDADNYSLWGSSAGGHLAASFATHEMGCSHYGLPQPAVLVLCYPVITMGAYGHKQSRQNLLGPHPSANLVQLTSVENHITLTFRRRTSGAGMPTMKSMCKTAACWCKHCAGAAWTTCFGCFPVLGTAWGSAKV